MIDLLAAPDRAGFGITAALDIEGIPYRHIARPEDSDGRLVVAVNEAATPVVALARRTPVLAIGVATALAREHFGVSGEVREGPASIALDEPVWPAAVRECARRFGREALRIPQAPVFSPAARPTGSARAHLSFPGGERQPAVVRCGGVHWCLVDLGSALANLLDERYAAGDGRPAPRPMSRTAFLLYYRAPEPIRRLVQRSVYAWLRRGVARCTTSSDYPVDATGWLLLELVRELVRGAAGGLVRLARWPAPYAAAAVLSHDVEPTSFAYTRGLEQLAADVDRSGHPATVGLVARPARHLTRPAAAWLRGRDVLCHGLEHRGETLAGSRAQVADGLGTARAEIEARLGRSVDGFRSPRLDRSPDLVWALDRVGFRYDSSYPDVDRENVSRFGAGVRLNVPFRAPVGDGAERVRPSRCLELPVSAPDCVQPLFAGDDVYALRAAVTRKIGFVRATGGLYVGIVHAGVFGPRDAALRAEHLRFVAARLRHRDLWLASASDVAAWWGARELVVLRVREDRAVVKNDGDETVEGLCLVIDSGGDETVRQLPALSPGESVSVAIERRAPADAAVGR